MLTQQQQLKYSRQIMLKKIGEQGQLALTNASVLIIGVGGLGNPAALYLAAAGVGKIILIDGDNVELSNLPRQILFSEQNLNTNKADAASDKLQQQFPDSDFEMVDEMFDSELADYYLANVDLVLDCTDNINSRYLINQSCVSHKIPLIIGAATGFDGQHLMVNPLDDNSACYHCLYPSSEKAPANNCQTAGIVGPVLSIVSGMQALTAIKYLTGNIVPINQLSLFDGLNNQWQQFNIKKNSQCPVCSTI
jgi:sulfur carrier protein ThiS adenylyltransferase